MTNAREIAAEFFEITSTPYWEDRATEIAAAIEAYAAERESLLRERILAALAEAGRNPQATEAMNAAMMIVRLVK